MNERPSSFYSKRVNRSQLEHIMRAAAANADTLDIVVIGSQAVLGAFPDAPTELLDSMEADVYPKEKDLDSVETMLRHRMICPKTMHERIAGLVAERKDTDGLLEARFARLSAGGRLD